MGGDNDERQGGGQRGRERTMRRGRDHDDNDDGEDDEEGQGP